MRSRFIVAGVAAAAALALVPAAGAQDGTAADDTAVIEPVTDPADDTADPTEPTEPTEPTAPRVAVSAVVEANGSMQAVDVAAIDAVADRLPAGTPVQWKYDGERPEAARALTADGRLYVAPPMEGTAQIPVLAVSTATGRTVLAVDVTIDAKAPGKSNNPDATRQPTTAKDVAIIVGSVLGVLGLLAAMVQFLVPGGWGQVIEFYT